MGMESQAGYVKQAHRAEAHEDTPVAKRIDALKKSFEEKKLAGPFDKSHQDILNKNVSDFFEMFSRGYKSVEHMENICKDGNKTETQKQFAMDDLDLLGKVVYESVRDNENFTKLIGEGSASEIDEKLPKEFKGIGKVVLTNVFEQGPVLGALRALDSKRAALRRMPDGEAKNNQIARLVDETMSGLMRLENLTTGQNYDREMCMAYLGMEMEELVGVGHQQVVASGQGQPEVGLVMQGMSPEQIDWKTVIKKIPGGREDTITVKDENGEDKKKVVGIW